MMNYTVISLYRYPIKAILGEKLSSVWIDERGVVGDRKYALANSEGKFASGKDTRRFVRVDGLFSISSYIENDSVYVILKDGNSISITDDDFNHQVSELLGESQLTIVKENSIPHLDEAPIHIVTQSSLDELIAEGFDGDVRRFRPNILLDCDMSDDDLVGKRITIGDAVIEITYKAERCRMTALPQQDLVEAPELLRYLVKNKRSYFGVYGTVLFGGKVSVSDEVVISDV